VTITALVVDLKSFDSNRASLCRDCFQYTLDVVAQGRAIGVHLDDTTLANSGAEPLVNALTALLDLALAR